MKSNTFNIRSIFFLVFLILIILILILFSNIVSAKNYRPEISGSFENGDKLYTDPSNLDAEIEEVVDYYSYYKQWLKYRQKIAVGEYYYLKVQRQKKEYENSDNYDHLNLEGQFNYTFYLTEKLRNRFKLLLRDKDYLAVDYREKDYQLARLQYTLQYELNPRHDCEVILQRQWTKYDLEPAKDYDLNRLALKWSWELSENLDLDSKIQFDKQINDPNSKSTDKSARKISLKFKYKL